MSTNRLRLPSRYIAVFEADQFLDDDGKEEMILLMEALYRAFAKRSEPYD